MDGQLLDFDNQFGLQSQLTPPPKKSSMKKIIGITVGAVILLVIIIFVAMKIISSVKDDNYHEEIAANIENIARNEDCSKILCLFVENGEEKYTKEFVPEELLAENPEEAAIVIKITAETVESFEYTNGAKAFLHNYTAEWKDYRINGVLAKKIFYGGTPPMKTSTGNQYGSKPESEAVTKWIRDTYDELFDNPCITENINGFNFAITPLYEKNEEGNYTYGDELIEIFEYNKAEYGIYTMEEFSVAFANMLKSMSEYYSISEYKENENGDPYITYSRHVVTKSNEIETDSGFKIPTEKEITTDAYFTNVSVLYETEDSFWAVGYQNYDGEYLIKSNEDKEKLIEKFINLSTLCSGTK